jgi:hypothetical protein
MTSITQNKLSLLTKLNSTWHDKALWVLMVIIIGHWIEHLAQAYQIFILGWARATAGGGLGLLFPALAQSEVLHFAYNLALFLGILLLQPGFRGRAKWWWTVAAMIQSWHFIEHALLQLQWLTGYYLFGHTTQTSILQLWFPRVELHFMYNLLVFMPLMIGFYYYLYPPASESAERSPAA